MSQLCILPDNDKVLSPVLSVAGNIRPAIYIRTAHSGLILSMSIWYMYIYISCTSEVLTQLLVQLNLYVPGTLMEVSLHARST